MHLLLDLDGTLINSSPGIYHSFSQACFSLGVQTPSFPTFCSFIGPPVQDIASRLYLDLDAVALENFRKIFREDYDSHSYRNFVWYPGVLDTLFSLASDQSLRISIVTNKPTSPSKELVKSAGMLPYFVDIVGIDYRVVHSTGAIFSSKAEALSFVLDSTSTHYSQSVYVGDTLGDRDACALTQVPFIAALYGFHQWAASDRPPLCLERFDDIHRILPIVHPTSQLDNRDESSCD